MSLVFAAITPHPPILLPSIGKEKKELLAKTEAAFLELEQDLYIAKPNVVIVISPHTGRFDDAFTVNAHTHYVSDYSAFGDLETKESWNGSPDFAAKIQHAANEEQLTVRLISEDALDYGASIPLHFLTAHIPEAKIVPIGYDNQSSLDHLKFGEFLKNIIMDSDKRVAVIASGDLAHCHTTDGPSGFHKDAKLFDDGLIELLETRNTLGIAQLDQAMVGNAQECGYRSIVILLGILKNMDYSFKRYSYETPLGVGYLVGNFSF